MKKLLLSFIISLLMITSFNAQTLPQGMKYQAVARDLSGEIISNQPISLKIQLQRELNSIQIYYTEVHTITTNQFGLFSLIVGQGSVEKGVFNEIPWATENIWMNVAIKSSDEAYYTPISTSKLMAVPYAFHAQTAGSINGNQMYKSSVSGVPSQNWSLFGNSKSDPEKDILGTTDYNDLILATDNLERMRIYANGDINIKKSLSIDENLTVKKNVYLNTLEGETINYGPFTVENKSPTLLTGKLHVKGLSQFDSNINVDASIITDKLVVSDEDDPDPTPRFGSLADIRGLFVADSIAIRGGVDIGGNLKVHGDSVVVDNHLVVGGMSNFKGQVTINANVTGGESSYDAYPLRVEGSDQGIAIKVTKETPGNSNNFVTFFDNNEAVRGRIEGETTTDLLTNPEYIFDNSVFAFDLFVNSADLFIVGQEGVIALAEEVQAIAEGVAYLASENICIGAGEGLGLVVVEVVCPPQLSEAATVASNIVLASANLFIAGENVVLALANEAEAIALPVAYNLFKHTQIGVTYQSGAGDYAEWLPKINIKDKFYPGDLVGVKAGKISYNTGNVENIMVISSNPIVLGNMPEDGKEIGYEKIAFMGQVPVKVHGIVNEGDYILPSGNNDGFGVAVSPDKLIASDYQKIVGIAWSSSNSTQLNFVNVAVGINANDVTKLVVKQANEINELKDRLDKIDVLLAKLDASDSIKGAQGKAEIPKVDNTDETNYEENVPSVTYTVITEGELEEGIKLAEESLRKSGVDVDKHPFFMKLKSNPEFKTRYLLKIINGYKKEIGTRSKIDKASGIKVNIQ